jgi:pimeloyl-ACP methyl ester carboxylesterase
VVAGRLPVIYLHGLAVGREPLSPALTGAFGPEAVTAVELPGFDGKAGFVAPAEYLDWLTIVWDRIDATGALPCPVIGASLGGMLAAELAVLRPEAVTALVLLAPLGMWDDTHPVTDVFAVVERDRLPVMFHGPVPDAFLPAEADRDSMDAKIARYLPQVAAASLMWPLPDHGLAKRIHRLAAPTLLLWGAEDRVAPPGLAARWPATHRSVIPGAGHLMEWDAPGAVGRTIREFLAAVP